MVCSFATSCEEIVALSSGRVTSRSRQSICKSCHAQGTVITPHGQHTMRGYELLPPEREVSGGKGFVSSVLRRAPCTARLPPHIRPVRSERRNLLLEAGCARHRAVGENRLHLRGSAGGRCPRPVCSRALDHRA